MSSYDAAGNLLVNIAAGGGGGGGGGSNASVGANGSALPTSSTLIGASDGTNEQPLQVESATNKNLRTSLYQGTNEATIAQFHNADNQNPGGTAYGLLTGGVAQLLNAVGNLDRQRSAYADGMPTTGIEGAGEMLWNGAAFDRARSVLVGDGVSGTGIGADGIMLYNGTTYDRLRDSLVSGAADVAIKNTPSVLLPDGSTSGTVQNDGDVVSITLPGGQATALVQITGTFVGTLLFEATPDGANWYGVYGNQINSTVALSTTGTGLWRVPVAGFTNFRVRLHPVTSGSASILLRLSSGVQSVFVNNASALGQANMLNSAPVVIASDQTPLPMNLKQVNGNPLSLSNPEIFETFIQNAIRNGQGYNGTSGTVNVAGAVNSVQFSLFNPGTKNIIIYSAKAFINQSAYILWKLITTDPALTAGQIVNNKLGGAAATATCTYSNAAQTVSGTNYDSIGTAAYTNNELFTNGSYLFLPAGSANGLTSFINVSSAGSMGWTVKWIEF